VLVINIDGKGTINNETKHKDRNNMMLINKDEKNIKIKMRRKGMKRDRKLIKRT
jgi:hypothetical protein